MVYYKNILLIFIIYFNDISLNIIKINLYLVLIVIR